jgi:single-strand DNA-binding protein
VANFLQKGKQVYLEGRLQSRSWDDKEGQKRYITEVVCYELILLGGRGDTAGAPAGPAGDFAPPVSMPRSAPRPQAAASEPPDDLNQGITDDDVPF